LGSIMPATGAYVQSLRIPLTAGTTNWWKFVPGGAHRWSALNVHLPNNHVCGHDNKVHIIFESDRGQKGFFLHCSQWSKKSANLWFQAKMCIEVDDLKELCKLMISSKNVHWNQWSKMPCKLMTQADCKDGL
jgi:hypothetical protein